MYDRVWSETKRRKVTRPRTCPKCDGDCKTHECNLRWCKQARRGATGK